MTVEEDVWEDITLFKIKTKVKNMSEVLRLAINKLKEGEGDEKEV